MTMLTKDEAELYDRQIRLWGVNAQSRLRQSKVLMIGFNGVASEVAKILVLAGIDTLTIVDDQPLQKEDITSNLFCRRDDSEFRTCEVSEKLKKLNPLVKVNIDTTSIHDKKPQDFENYDLVTLHSFMTLQQTTNINDICRKANIKFYIVLDYGFFGFMFSDLGPKFEFTYEPPTVENTKSVEAAPAPAPAPASASVVELSDDIEEDRPKKRARFEDKKSAEPTRLQHSLTYATFHEMIQTKEFQDSKSSPVLFLSMAIMRFYSEQKRLPRNADDLSMLNKIMAYIKDTLNLDDNVFKRLNPEWSENISGSLSPVCAIVGGVAGQDMIRALSGSGIPICNTFSFDGLEMSGTTEKIGVEGAKVKPIVHDVIDIDSD